VNALALPAKIPGSALWNTVRFAKNPLTFLSGTRALGSVVWLPFPGRDLFVVHDPELIEEVLIKRHHDYIKDKFTRALGDSLGNGLLLSEGDVWKRQRRLMQPAFHKQRIEAYADTMVSEAESTLRGWRDGEQRDVHVDMMRTTSEIAAITMFGAHMGDAGAELSRGVEDVMRRYLGVLGTGIPLPASIPTPTNVRFRRALSRLDELVHSFIQQRRKSTEPAGDLLSLLLAAHDDDGGAPMSDQQLRDECVTLFVAGHETTALALSYSLLLLAEHPDALGRLRAELAVLGSRSPRYADLQALRFTEAVVKEAMRLYPPAWAIGREAIVDTSLGRYRVPKGAEVALIQWSAHRDPRWFARPEAFVPERWLAQDDLPRFGYFPFGGGPRVCIGNHFAMTEAVLVLATLMSRFQVKPATTRRLRFMPSVTLRPRGGVPLRVYASPASGS
jgi:cytochrome P450